jgi:hypothetical protein
MPTTREEMLAAPVGTQARYTGRFGTTYTKGEDNRWYCLGEEDGNEDGNGYTTHDFQHVFSLYTLSLPTTARKLETVAKTLNGDTVRDVITKKAEEAKRKHGWCSEIDALVASVLTELDIKPKVFKVGDNVTKDEAQGLPVGSVLRANQADFGNYRWVVTREKVNENSGVLLPLHETGGGTFAIWCAGGYKIDYLGK